MMIQTLLSIRVVATAYNGVRVDGEQYYIGDLICANMGPWYLGAVKIVAFPHCPQPTEGHYSKEQMLRQKDEQPPTFYFTQCANKSRYSR